MIKFDSQKHHRRSIRLPHYDYSQAGAYFVTIVTRHRECLFGKVITDQSRGAAMLRPYDHRNAHKINVQPGSLGAIVRSYKSAVSYRINKELNGTAVWQRNYYEHIIRNEKDLQNTTDYVEANPLLWQQDEDSPANVTQG